MKLYLKILRFLRPHWRLILVAVGLAIAYVVFNGVSLWVSVDFIQELFTPAQNASLSTAAAGTEAARPLSRVPASPEAASSTGAARGDAALQDPAAGRPSPPPHEDGPDGRPALDPPGDLSAGPAAALKKRFNLTDRIKLGFRRLLVRPNREDTLKLVCLVIFLSFVLKNLAMYLKRVVTNFIELQVVTRMRNELHHTLLRLPVGYFDTRHSGTLTSLVFNDVHAVNVVLNDSFGKMILVPIQTLGYLALLVSLSWKLSLLTFTIVPVSAVLITKIGQSVRRKSRRVLQRVSNVLAAFQESMMAIRIVKAFGGEAKEGRKFEAENREYFKVQFRRNRLSFATSPLSEILGVLILVALLWFGGRLVTRGTDLSADDFVRYLVFLFAAFQPLRELSGLNNTIQAGLAAAERIFTVLEETPEPYEPPRAAVLKSFRRAVEYDDVTFRYKPEGPDVLERVSLRIDAGQTVAFVGPSGSGKTTLVNLLPRFYDPNAGAVRVDGRDTRGLTLASLRRQIGIVTQESVLFNDSVRANLSYALDGASDARLRAAAEAANAWEFIRGMEGGLDARIGERGVNLSGGQRQRLSIARAILKNPPILILDEATSALDTESERLVQDAIERLMRNRTVLAIAHRLSTVIRADTIVVMHHGRILDRGTHPRLVRSCGLYRKLYRMQFHAPRPGRAGSGD